MSDQPETAFCPHCHKAIVVPLPVQPLYPLEFARMILLLPSMGAMYTALWKHKAHLSPPKYAYENAGRRSRLLTLGDIQTLRRLQRPSTIGATKWLRSLVSKIEL